MKKLKEKVASHIHSAADAEMVAREHRLSAGRLLYNARRSNEKRYAEALKDLGLDARTASLLIDVYQADRRAAA